MNQFMQLVCTTTQIGIQFCDKINMEKYQIIGRIGEGAHGIVMKAKERQVLDGT